MKRLIVSGIVMETLLMVGKFLGNKLQIWQSHSFDMLPMISVFSFEVIFHILLGICICSTTICAMKASKKQLIVPLVFVIYNLGLVCYYIRRDSDVIAYACLLVGYWGYLAFLYAFKNII